MARNEEKYKDFEFEINDDGHLPEHESAIFEKILHSAQLNFNKSSNSSVLIDWHLPQNKFGDLDDGESDFIYENLEQIQIKRAAKKLARAKKFFRKRDLSKIEINSLDDPKAIEILAEVDRYLIDKGLYREESQEVIFCEAFPIEQIKDADELSYKRITFIDFSGHQFDIDGPDSESNDQGEGLLESISTDSLKLVVTPAHNLMRRAPWSFHEQIARTMIENGFFENYPEYENLLPAASFFSVGILDEDIFELVRKDAYVGGPFHVAGKELTFAEYKSNLKNLKPLLDFYIREFYFDLPHIKTAISAYLRSLNIDSKVETLNRLDSLWFRLRKTLESLSAKQHKALEYIYLLDVPETYKGAAQKLGISKDSFQDRVKGAVKKLKDALPELLFLPEELTSRRIRESGYMLNSLYDKLEGEVVRPLFELDFATGEFFCAKARVAAPKIRELSAREILRLRAKIYAVAPFPDFFDTEYFCGVHPSAYFTRLNGSSTFIGHGLSHKKIHDQRRQKLEASDK